MGRSSRRRATARIVKKSRRPIAKGNAPNLNKLPQGLRQNWDKNLSSSDNYSKLGLVSNPSPSFRQRKEGHKVMKEGVKAQYKRRFGHEMKNSDDEESEEDEEPKVTISDMFPYIKSEKVAPYKKTIGKLKWDEVRICKNLIAKYGDNGTKVRLFNQT